MLELLLDLIFPRQCVSCGKWGKFICDDCQKKIEYFDLPNPPAGGGGQVCPYCERNSSYGLTHPRCLRPWGLDGMFVLAHYRGPIREALRSAKYQGTFGLFGELGKLVLEKYHYRFDFDYFVPVPLHPNRERERGFNQAGKLAETLAKVLNGNEIQDVLRLSSGQASSGTQVRNQEKRSWKKVIKLLQRMRETKPQFGLRYEERKKNMIGAFGIAGHLSLVTGHSFCLVDDVATTGATIFECAKVLKRAGAKKVWAICAARGG